MSNSARSAFSRTSNSPLSKVILIGGGVLIASVLTIAYFVTSDPYASVKRNRIVPTSGNYTQEITSSPVSLPVSSPR